ncbi:hypothetical protein O7606_00760 [Micromonospora sp. WMMD882]|uniref:hypothetical protein n=1 Tax=Micromonospora sp. WMMD882 TaxID=3015151 RepID=UPI00248ABB2D|nr:hypothetical protein [Micromonospora sp. WMMD882]WBB79973.1 hypothetical protein O7606_00760 [Micromonospora sp. WMMD882]
MVYVRLNAEWTDQDGVVHDAGDTVDVDNATLAELQAAGIVTDGSKNDTGAGTTEWVGPTSTKP